MSLSVQIHQTQTTTSNQQEKGFTTPKDKISTPLTSPPPINPPPLKKRKASLLPRPIIQAPSIDSLFHFAPPPAPSFDSIANLKTWREEKALQKAITYYAQFARTRTIEEKPPRALKLIRLSLNKASKCLTETLQSAKEPDPLTKMSLDVLRQSLLRHRNLYMALLHCWSLRCVVDLNKVLGSGTFSEVFEGTDLETNTQIAIKIHRTAEGFFKAARIELRIFQQLAKTYPEGAPGVIRLEKSTRDKKPLCLIFNKQATNLYRLQKTSAPNGFSLTNTLYLGSQALQGLVSLHTAEIIHRDIKPENLLERKGKLLITDLGSACFFSQELKDFNVQSLFYRSLEVLLQIPYDEKIDMWSFGCVLVELYSGRALLQSQTDLLSFLHTMQDVIGPFPQDMITKSPKKDTFFTKDEETDLYTLKPLRFKTKKVSLDKRLALTFPVEEKRYILNRSTTLEELKARFPDSHHAFITQYWNFRDLVLRCLTYDPEKRISAQEAMAHPAMASFFLKSPSN